MIIPDYHSVSVYAIRACEGRSLQKSSVKSSSYCYERQRLGADFLVFTFEIFKVKKKVLVCHGADFSGELKGVIKFRTCRFAVLFKHLIFRTQDYCEKCKEGTVFFYIV